jgi:hypothetical protein
MYRFYFKFIVLNVFLLSLISTGLIAFGKAQPPHPALAGFGVCDGRPCWNGIVPGVTTMEQANQLITAAGYTDPPEFDDFVRRETVSWNFFAPANSRLCNVSLWYRSIDLTTVDPTSVVSAVSLTACDDLTLGELMTEIGDPNGVRQITMGIPEGPILLLNGVNVVIGNWWRVNSTNYAIRLNGSSSLGGSPWVGFVNPALYCYLTDYSLPLCGASFRPINRSRSQSTETPPNPQDTTATATWIPAQSPEEDAPLPTLAP